MNIGVLTSEFARSGADALFGKIASFGFGPVQLAFDSVTEAEYEKDGKIEFPAEFDSELVKKIKKISDSHNIQIIAVNGTFNMAHPDASVRGEGVRRMAGLMEAARALGAGIVTLCSGTRNADYLWRHHPDNGTETAWADMLDSMRRTTELAEKYEITVALEIEYNNVVDTPEKARRLIDAVGSRRLGAIMDCANLFHPGDAYRANAAPVIERAFALIGNDVVMAHGKDIAEGPGIKFCPTGEGIVDYGLFMRLLADRGFQGDMVLHGIFDEAKMPAGIAKIKEALRF